MTDQLWIVRVNGQTDADPATMMQEGTAPLDMEHMYFPEGFDPDTKAEIEEAIKRGEKPEVAGFMTIKPPTEFPSDYTDPELARYRDDLKQKCGIMYTQIYDAYTQFLGEPPSECGFGQGTWSIGAVIKTPQLLTLSTTLVDRFNKALGKGILSMQIYPVFEQVAPDGY